MAGGHHAARSDDKNNKNSFVFSEILFDFSRDPDLRPFFQNILTSSSNLDRTAPQEIPSIPYQPTSIREIYTMEKKGALKEHVSYNEKDQLQ
jgi:hypothetical protein